MRGDDVTISECWPSLAVTAMPLVEALVAQADALRIGISRSATGARLIDAGIRSRGGLQAGLRIAEICLAGLGRVELTGGGDGRWPFSISVVTSDPVLACLASQYAGWSLSHGEGPEAYYAICSGPGRALAAREPLYQELGYRDRAEQGIFVLEVDQAPPDALIERIAGDCGLAPDRLAFVMTPTQSLAGTVQIVARVLEVAMHKIHELGFPLERVVDGMASAPLPPPAPDFVEAMGRTNDAIIYGGRAQIFVTGDDAAARNLAERLPSRASRDYGRPFAETFKAVRGDFYAIDPMLFSPAQVTVTALESGNSFHAGALDPALIDRSFG